jgi:hypothetical protein
MRANADPRMTLLFGSGTRATVLTVLANAYQPLSGYRIARTGGVAQPKVHLQLHRLQRAGVVEREDAGWVLADSSLRALFQGRGRVLGWEDWTRERQRRELAGVELAGLLRDLQHKKPPKDWVPRNQAQYERPPIKDRLNRRLGLAESYHAGH